MLGRFCRYIEKVFDFGAELARLPDPRKQPQIPMASIVLSAFVMFVTRLRSLNAMQQQARAWPGRWEALAGGRKPSPDRVGEVLALTDPEPLRDMLSNALHRLRRNKTLAENPWALRFVALDGHEFFSQS